MALTDLERYSVYPAVFDSVTLRDVINVSPSAGIQKLVVTPGGALDPGLLGLISIDPVLTLSVVNLGTALAAVSPVTGLEIGTLAKVQYQQRDDGGSFVSGSNHVTISSAKGFLVPESIQAQQDDQSPALLNLKYWGLKSGSTPPMQVNVTQALASSPLVAGAYKLGPVVIDATILGGIQRSQVNFGVGYQTKRANGDTAPSVGSITKRGATAEITGNNMSLANAADFDLIACSTSIVIYYLLVGGSGSVHTAITFGAGSTYELSEVPAQGDQDAETRLMITAKGSITIDTAAAYPT